MQHKMRRTDRQLSTEDAISILRDAEFGVMSTISENQAPYGVPLNFCLIEKHIYFHCAIEGHKITNITENPKVSFCAVGNTCVIPEEFDTKYESVIVSGIAIEVFSKEKQIALEGLLSKYSPKHFQKGLKYIQNLYDKTRIFKISIDTISGKARK
jgi:nitroimidazol reductase NimA-like FMN-containing flavoprotein (pyridoxamine 5'-phosphate oxidase superfamily)